MGDSLNWGAVTARGGKKGKAAAAPLNFDISILVSTSEKLGARRASRAAAPAAGGEWRRALATQCAARLRASRRQPRSRRAFCAVA
jgi:hypothetical protein